MLDSTLLIQLLALGLFAVCLYHSWLTEGSRAAQEWFIPGYVFSMLALNLLVATEQVEFSPAMLLIGAAPSLTLMLFPAVFYLAYAISGHLVNSDDLRAMAYLMFLITPALILPVDAIALVLNWWRYPSDSRAFLDGVPFYLPWAWGILASSFYLVVGRIRRIRFRGSGRLFAMTLAAPVVAVLDIALIAVAQVGVNVLGELGGEAALYGALLVLFFTLPALVVLRTLRPREAR
jgi:hypothetical protein